MRDFWLAIAECLIAFAVFSVLVSYMCVRISAEADHDADIILEEIINDD